MTGAEKQKTILLVEDEAITAMAEKMALEKYGYTVFTASSGEEAITTMEKTPAIDLILMDINLGKGRDGTEAAAIILKNHDIPVVFLSSHMEPDVVAKTEKITSYGYVVKDSSITVLDASIKMAFKLFAAKIREKRVEDELRKRNRYIESILDNMPIGFAVNTIDDGVARYQNDNFTKIYGWPKEVLTDIDRFFEKVYPGEYGRELKARVISDMGSGDPKRMAWDDLKITTSTGEHRYISARNIPILEQNLMVSTVWDTTRMHESLTAQQESEKRYQSILNASPDGIAITDIEGRLLLVSPAVLNIFAYERQEELLGHTFSNFIVPEDHERAAANVALMFQGTMTGPGEYRGLRADGSTFAIEVNGEFVRGAEGQPTQIVFIVRDISGRKKAETTLHESEERLRNIIFSMADWVWEVDTNGVYTYSSEKGQDFFGISRGDIIGKTPFDFMPADEAKRVALIFADIVAAKAPIRDLENWNIGRDGERICLLTNGVPILDKDGNFKGYRGVDKDITEHKKVQLQREAALTALLDSENKYRELVENHHDVIFSVDAVGKIQYISPAITSITGYTQEEVTGRNLFDFFGPEERDRYTTQMRQTMESGSSIGEFLITVKNQSSKWIRASSTCVVENGKITGVRGIMSDITDHKQAEKENEQIISLQKATLESTADGILVISESGRITDFNQSFARMWHIPDSILETRDDTQLLRFVLEQVLDPQGFLAKVNELYAAPEQESFDQLHFKDGRCFERYSRPQLISGRPVGRVWSFRDISARQRAESQREAALAALEESKERYENFISQISDGVYRFEPDAPMPLTLPVEEQIDYLYRHMFIAECNPSLMDMYGIKEPGDILGKTQMDFHGGSDNPLNRQVLRDFIQSGYRTRNVITEEIDIHGNKKYFSNNTIGIIKSNHLIRMWGTQTDISEQKRAQEALQESEERFRTLYEDSPLGLYRTTPDGRIQLANPALIRMLGYSSFADLARINLEQSGFSPSHSRARFINEIEKNGEIKGMEYAWKRKDGTSVLVRESARAIRDAQGKTLYFDGIVEDISELKRTEAQKVAALKALQVSEERYRALVENASDLVYSTDRAGHFTYVNRAALTITGYEERELIGNLFTFLIRPDMRVRAFRFYGRQLGKGINNTYFEIPVITKDGREVWLGQNAQLTIEDGQVTGFQAVSRDISERKQVEAALRASEAKQSNAMQMTKAGHWEYDVDRDEFTFNDNFYRIFRTTAAAVGGYKMSSGEYARRFCHPDDMAQVGLETQMAIETRDPDYNRQIEHRILYTDGEIGWIAVRFFISKNSQGRTVKTYGVNQDITERKHAEAEIKKQLAEKEVLLKEVHHRIKNNIASISGLISLRLQSINHPQAIAVLKDTNSRVDSMRILYDKLLLTEDYDDLSVKNYLDDLTETIVALFPGKAKVKLDRQIADFNLNAKRLFPLGIIINELLTNIMKYAFINRKIGRIEITLTLEKKHVRLTIQDNGVGLPAGFDIEQSKGFGLLLVKMLSQQLGGSFSMEKRKGTRCTLKFDI